MGNESIDYFSSNQDVVMGEIMQAHDDGVLDAEWFWTNLSGKRYMNVLEYLQETDPAEVMARLALMATDKRFKIVYTNQELIDRGGMYTLAPEFCQEEIDFAEYLLLQVFSGE